MVGASEGTEEGWALGAEDGNADGTADGWSDGAKEGTEEGDMLTEGGIVAKASNSISLLGPQRPVPQAIEVLIMTINTRQMQMEIGRDHLRRREEPDFASFAVKNSKMAIPGVRDFLFR